MTKPKPEQQVVLAGYSDRLSARPGETVKFQVSYNCSSKNDDENAVNVQARLTQSICADPNPKGPGMEERDASSWFEPLTFPARHQSWNIGSWAVSSLPIVVVDAAAAELLQVHIWCLPTLLPCDHDQYLWSWGPLNMFISCQGLVHVACATTGTSARTQDDDKETGSSNTSQQHQPITIVSSQKALIPHKWYKICLDIQQASASVRLTMTTGSVSDTPHIITEQFGMSDDGGEPNRLSIDNIFSINDRFSLSTNGTFNGKIEAPMVLLDGQVLASWNLSDDMTSWSIPPATGKNDTNNGGSLILHNAPTRAVTGRLWNGSEMNWQRRPDQYAAIYFHDDDVYDFQWETDFEWTIPKDCPSGIYIMRIELENKNAKDKNENQFDQTPFYDAMPIFVCAPEPSLSLEHTERQTKICILVSTFTYVLYGNHARPDFDPSWLDRIKEWNAYPNNPAIYKAYGQSTYNYHSDGVSGICHASHKRPLFNLRPGYQTFGNSTCSGLRHFPADSHLIAWFHNKNIPYEIITDDELDREGAAAIRGYQCLVTGTHPEYHTENTLNALTEYRDVCGGNIAYLGGNGFYWRIVRHAEDPSLLEIRRAEGGIRAWASEPGEYYSAFDGTYGGLWRRCGRPPQQLVGVGFTAQGTFVSLPYQRVCRDPAFDWLFVGIKEANDDKNDSVLGDFGYSGHGAAGFELDRVDPRSIHVGKHNAEQEAEGRIVVLAQSVQDQGDPPKFVLVPEEVLTHLTILSGGTTDEAKRADMIYWKPSRQSGQVFSTGSICFCGSLPWNNFDNSISKLLENVIGKFTEKTQNSVACARELE